MNTSHTTLRYYFLLCVGAFVSYFLEELNGVRTLKSPGEFRTENARRGNDGVRGVGGKQLCSCVLTFVIFS
jgi:hypothetical protein